MIRQTGGCYCHGGNWTDDLGVTVGLIFKNTGRTYFVDERSSTLVKKHIGQP